MSNSDLTIKEAATLLQRSDKTIRRLLADSQFPSHYRDSHGKIFIPLSDIDNYLHPNRVNAPATSESPSVDTQDRQVSQVTPHADPHDTPRPSLAKHTTFRLAFGSWFLYEKQYYRVDKHRFRFRRFKLFVLQTAISGTGFVSALCQRLKTRLEERKALIEGRDLDS